MTSLRARRLERTILLSVAAALFVASFPAVHLRLSNAIFPSLAWAKRAALTSRLLLLAGLAALGLAAAGARLGPDTLTIRAVRFCGEVLDEARRGVARAWRLCSPSPARGIALLAVIAVGAWARAAFLTQPMRFDESWAFLTFDLGGLARVFDYSAPNNHVLHTLLVKISILSFGAHPASIRLPAFFAGTLSIPATFLLARALLPWLPALFAAAATAAMPYLILYSTNARGYSLIALWTVLLLLAVIRFEREPSTARLFIACALAALGMLTVPTMLFALAGVLCWMTAVCLANGWPLRRVAFRFVLPFGALTGGLTFLLYLPVIFFANGVTPLVASPWVAPQPWQEFVTLLRRRSLADFGRDIPSAALVALLALLVAGVAASARRRKWEIALMLPALALGAAVVLVLHRATPYARMWIYLIPAALVTSAAGAAPLVERLTPRAELAAALAAPATAALFASSLVSRGAIARYEDTGRFAEADTVVRYLQPILRKGDRIEARLPANWPLSFYLWYRGVPAENAHGSPRGRTFFVVEKRYYSIGQLTDKPVIELFETGDGAIYRIGE